MENKDLDKRFKGNSFDVPTDYFDSFDSKVLNQLYKKEQPLKVWRNIRKWGIAASIFLAIGVAFFLIDTEDTQPLDLAVVNVNEVELIDFQKNNELNEDEFIELLNEKALDSLYLLEILPIRNVKFSNKEIENMEAEYSPLDDEIEI